MKSLTSSNAGRRWNGALHLLWAVLLGCGMAYAEAPVRVVTTLSTFADLVKAVGAEQVDVAYVASPRFNAHFIEPKPSDVLKLRRADLFVHAGLDFELWRFPLADAAARAELRPGGARELDLSRGVRLLEVPAGIPSRSEGDIHGFGNPHYWLDPENALVMTRNIATKLGELRPAESATFNGNAERFAVALRQDMQRWQSAARAVKGRHYLAYHNEWLYLAGFLGVNVERFLEPKPGIPPTPSHLFELRKYMQADPIAGVIIASFNPKREAEQLAAEGSSQVLVLAQNVGELDGTESYRKLLEHNVTQLTGGIR